MKITMIASLLAVALAAAPALATLYPQFPIGDSVWKAGTERNITWQDNGAAPSAAGQTFKIELQTGTDAEQVTLAVVGERVPGNLYTVPFTIRPDIGPSGKVYFFRFTPTQGEIVWSTRFTLTDATGAFPPSVKLPPGSTVDVAPGATASPIVPTPTGTATDGAPTPTTTTTTTDDNSKPTQDTTKKQPNPRGTTTADGDSAAPRAASFTGHLATAMLMMAGIAVGALLL